MAIKWLGNAGGHDGTDQVTLDDVMDAYELTERILQEVYAPKLSKLKSLARNKAPIGGRATQVIDDEGKNGRTRAEA